MRAPTRTARIRRAFTPRVIIDRGKRLVQRSVRRLRRLDQRVVTLEPRGRARGRVLLSYIIDGGLVWIDDEEPTVLIWSGNAAEQLEALVIKHRIIATGEWEAEAKTQRITLDLLRAALRSAPRLQFAGTLSLQRWTKWWEGPRRDAIKDAAGEEAKP